ncbi:MAG TPA: LysE family translocator [Gaiellaceae bacterium]|nr:LysE family translocator [Gaiellaceae bacterium]
MNLPSASAFALFCLASIALAVVPGPAVTYIVTQSVDKGRRAGLASACGVATGGLVHVAAATVGLSALIASSAAAFTVVKLVGAAYLIVVGIRRILDRSDDEPVAAAPARLRRIYRQGVVVNVLNPKTALFFLAFLPQFVDTRHGAVWPQVAILGLTFAVIAFASDALYATLADLIASRLRRVGRGARLRRYATGGIFIALGATAAVARRAT